MDNRIVTDRDTVFDGNGVIGGLRQIYVGIMLNPVEQKCAVVCRSDDNLLSVLRLKYPISRDI